MKKAGGLADGEITPAGRRRRAVANLTILTRLELAEMRRLHKRARDWHDVTTCAVVILVAQKEVSKVGKKERKVKKSVIAYRKKCKASGTGLSHYALSDKK